MVSNNVDVSVEDSSSNEECLNFVVFLLMEVENFLDSEGSVLFFKDLTLLLATKLAGDLLRNGKTFAWLSFLKVVLHLECFFKGSDS